MQLPEAPKDWKPIKYEPDDISNYDFPLQNLILSNQRIKEEVTRPAPAAKAPEKKKRKKKLTADEKFEKEMREFDEKLVRDLRTGKKVIIDGTPYKVTSYYPDTTPGRIKEDRPKGTSTVGRFYPDWNAPIGQNVVAILEEGVLTLAGKNIGIRGAMLKK